MRLESNFRINIDNNTICIAAIDQLTISDNYYHQMQFLSNLFLDSFVAVSSSHFWLVVLILTECLPQTLT